MKMLQRVRKLEAAGATFANKMLKDLPVFGEGVRRGREGAGVAAAGGQGEGARAAAAVAAAELSTQQ
jgi:hypothetical protein